MYKAVSKLINKCNTIAIFMHINPDGDSLGSSLCLYAFLKKMGKRVNVFAEEENAVSDKFKFLPYTDCYNTENLEIYDLSILVDCAEFKRIGTKCFEIAKFSTNYLIIDHHIIDKPFTPNYVIEPHSPSTTQILYKILKEIDASLIDKDMAALLYTGLLTDSGGFTFDSVTSETFRIAGELLEYNIPSSKICEKVFKATTFNIFKMKNRVLREAEFFLNNQVGVVHFYEELFTDTNTTQEHTEGVVNDILNIDGIELAISIAELKEEVYKISLRTKDKLDANICAKCFGGGGHKHASGCRLYGKYEDVLNKLLVMTKDMLND